MHFRASSLGSISANRSKKEPSMVEKSASAPPPITSGLCSEHDRGFTGARGVGRTLSAPNDGARLLRPRAPHGSGHRRLWDHDGTRQAPCICAMQISPTLFAGAGFQSIHVERETREGKID